MGWVILFVIWFFVTEIVANGLMWVVLKFPGASNLNFDGLAIIVGLVAMFWPYWLPGLFGLLFSGIGKLFGDSD